MGFRVHYIKDGHILSDTSYLHDLECAVDEVVRKQQLHPQDVVMAISVPYLAKLTAPLQLSMKRLEAHISDPPALRH